MKKLIVLVMVLLVVVFAGIFLTVKTDKTYQIKFCNWPAREDTLIIRYVNNPVVDFFTTKTGERKIVAKYLSSKRKTELKGTMTGEDIYLFATSEFDEEGKACKLNSRIRINRFTGKGHLKHWFVYGPEKEIMEEVNRRWEKDYGSFTCKKITRKF